MPETQRGPDVGRTEEEPVDAEQAAEKERRQEPSVLLQTSTEETESYPLGGEEELEQISADDNAEAVLEEIDDYTDDPEILQDFLERQQMPLDEQGLRRRLREHHSETPQLSADDVDVAWDQGEDVGDETVSAEPTPDRDIVDDIGKAVGLTYEDDETLDFAAKVWKRDEERWELDPASADDEAAVQGEGDGPASDK